MLLLLLLLFSLYIFWQVQIIKNHAFCYNFSCVNVCEIRICHLFYFFIRSTMYHLLRLHERITLCNCLSSSSSSRIREVGIVNRFSGFQNYCNMTDRDGEFSFLQGILVRIDIRIYIAIFIRPVITKFGKQVHLQDLIQIRLIKQVLVTSLLQDHATN